MLVKKSKGNQLGLKLFSGSLQYYLLNLIILSFLEDMEDMGDMEQSPSISGRVLRLTVKELNLRVVNIVFQRHSRAQVGKNHGESSKYTFEMHKFQLYHSHPS